jgi:tetratricopeptide (TPR) repeat protein
MITEGRAENFYQAHRYDDAIAVVLNMSNPRVGWVALANSYFMQGNYRETLKLREVANPVDLNGYVLRAVTQIRTGDRATGMKTLEEMGRNQHKAGTVHNYVPPAYLAWAYAVIGEKDRSLAWLQKATQQHDPTLANLKTDPGFDTLRDDPKFIEVMHKVGFAN